MDPKEMATRLRENDPYLWERSLRNELADFLDNLPTVPPTHTWNGTIRQPRKGEEALLKNGAVAEVTGFSEYLYSSPILTKVPPEFEPGEIVTNGEYCRYIGRQGERLYWDGSGCLIPNYLRWRKANIEDINRYMQLFPDVISKHLINEICEKYGEGNKQ